MLLADTADRLDPMSLLLYMSLFSCALLLPAAKILEPQARGAEGGRGGRGAGDGAGGAEGSSSGEAVALPLLLLIPHHPPNTSS